MHYQYYHFQLQTLFLSILSISAHWPYVIQIRLWLLFLSSHTLIKSVLLFNFLFSRRFIILAVQWAHSIHLFKAMEKKNYHQIRFLRSLKCVVGNGYWISTWSSIFLCVQCSFRAMRSASLDLSSSSSDYATFKSIFGTFSLCWQHLANDFLRSA